MKLHISLILRVCLTVKRGWLSANNRRNLTVSRPFNVNGSFCEEYPHKALVIDYDPAIHKEGAVITIDGISFTLKQVNIEVTDECGQEAKCHAHGTTPIEISVTKSELLGFNFDEKTRKATRKMLANTKLLSTVFR
jgi:hypothetical protein